MLLPGLRTKFDVFSVTYKASQACDASLAAHQSVACHEFVPQVLIIIIISSWHGHSLCSFQNSERWTQLLITTRSQNTACGSGMRKEILVEYHWLKSYRHDQAHHLVHRQNDARKQVVQTVRTYCVRAYFQTMRWSHIGRCWCMDLEAHSKGDRRRNPVEATRSVRPQYINSGRKLSCSRDWMDGTTMLSPFCPLTYLNDKMTRHPSCSNFYIDQTVQCYLDAWGTTGLE